ncbi:ABC transporter ATP-binding protein [Hoyosella rhizosphaerae]|nr:ABC transporter ATP-binding protein [Hoyosella rhizosphaerae]MBN4926134.1 ABC transporter ATP-binding protein [Hoyosella rhizosphaerae]
MTSTQSVFSAALYTAEFRSVSKSAADRPVLRDVSFGVGAGEVWGLLGPNGSGKSTLLRILAGLLRPDDGSAFLFGCRVRSGMAELARVRFAFESRGLLPHHTGLANLHLALRARGLKDTKEYANAIQRAAERSELGGALSNRVSTYSLGMRQRLALAIATLGDPNLIVLDEPTNGLDHEHVIALREHISKYARTGGAVLLTSHCLAEVSEMCTHIAMLRDGELVICGPIGTLTPPDTTVTVLTPNPDSVWRVLSAHPAVTHLRERSGGVTATVKGDSPVPVVRAATAMGVEVSHISVEDRVAAIYRHAMNEGGRR